MEFKTDSLKLQNAIDEFSYFAEGKKANDTVFTNEDKEVLTVLELYTLMKEVNTLTATNDSPTQPMESLTRVLIIGYFMGLYFAENKKAELGPSIVKKDS